MNNIQRYDNPSSDEADGPVSALHLPRSYFPGASLVAGSRSDSTAATAKGGSSSRKQGGARRGTLARGACYLSCTC